MERKKDSFVSIGETLSGLDGPVKAIREASPPARLMALCSLPRSNPGNRLQYKRVNGPYKLIMRPLPSAAPPH